MHQSVPPIWRWGLLKVEETLQQLLAAGLEKCLASAEAESAASLGTFWNAWVQGILWGEGSYSKNQTRTISTPSHPNGVSYYRPTSVGAVPAHGGKLLGWMLANSMFPSSPSRTLVMVLEPHYRFVPPRGQHLDIKNVSAPKENKANHSKSMFVYFLWHP